MPELSSAAVLARPDKRVLPADDTLIQVLAMAVHDICGRPTAAQLQEMRRSVERACLMPKHIGWDRRAAAHAEIFALLADATNHPVLAQMLNSGVGLTHHLMIVAGPAAGLMTANSSERLLAFLSAEDAEGAAHEAERHLQVLRFMDVSPTALPRAPRHDDVPVSALRSGRRCQRRAGGTTGPWHQGAGQGFSRVRRHGTGRNPADATELEPLRRPTGHTPEAPMSSSSSETPGRLRHAVTELGARQRRHPVGADLKMGPSGPGTRQGGPA